MTDNRMLGAWRLVAQLLITVAIAGFLTPPSVAYAGVPTSVDRGLQDIDIPPGTTVEALERLAKQFGLELVYDPDQLKGLQSPGVHGRMTAIEAVRQVLKGQNLRLIEHPDGAVLVTPIATENSQPGISRTTAQELGPALTQGPETEAAPRRDIVLNKIVVTGTHIEGETPVGSTLSVHTRDDMERSGSATVDQYGRKMPENYSGTDSMATLNTNGGVGVFEQGASSNVFGGGGFNLKGLGPGSTLTLLNGHRLAAGGLDGATVDVSQIPLSAVDHIEVLDDGASAIYGSDAVAGVVNIITRHDFEGAETNVRYGRATQGGATESTASQLVGNSWEGGNAMLDYEFDDQGGLDASQRSWIPSQGSPFSLIPKNRRQSIYLSSHEDVTANSVLSADVLYSDRHFESNGLENATDPIFDDPQQSAGHADQSSVVVNFAHDFPDILTAEITGNYSSVRQTSNSNSLSLGSAAEGESESRHVQANSSIASVDALVTESLFRLPGGILKVSLGGAYRTEQFNSELSSNSVALTDSQISHVSSVYGEIIAPVIENGQQWLQRLEFSGAFRLDRYQGFGTTRNPKFGWLWEPTTGLQLKGTGGTSFKAPLLSQSGAPITSYTAFFPSLGSNGKDDVLIVNGGQAGLHAETATSVTVGLDFQPAAVQGLTTSLNYFWLRFDNRIQQQAILPQPILSQPQLAYISETVSQEAPILPYFQSPGFLGDGAGLGPAGVDMIVYNTYANTTSTLERGLNASGHYRWNEAFGHFDASFTGQVLLADTIRTTFFAPQLSIDNTVGEPPKFKGRGEVEWTGDAWSADLAANYVNAYRNTLYTPYQSINAWTTVDAYVGYSTPSNASSLWSDVQIGFSAQNLFDRRPPFLQVPQAYLTEGRGAIPFDGANASPVGLQLALQVRKRW